MWKRKENSNTLINNTLNNASSNALIAQSSQQPLAYPIQQMQQTQPMLMDNKLRKKIYKKQYLNMAKYENIADYAKNLLKYLTTITIFLAIFVVLWLTILILYGIYIQEFASHLQEQFSHKVGWSEFFKMIFLQFWHGAISSNEKIRNFNILTAFTLIESAILIILLLGLELKILYLTVIHFRTWPDKLFWLFCLIFNLAFFIVLIPMMIYKCHVYKVNKQKNLLNTMYTTAGQPIPE